MEGPPLAQEAAELDVGRGGEKVSETLRGWRRGLGLGVLSI